MAEQRTNVAIDATSPHAEPASFGYACRVAVQIVTATAADATVVPPGPWWA